MLYTIPMRHSIDPKIDCVFKALLGAESNRRLLIHFLNAVLDAALPAAIRQVDILNPFNEVEFVGDKLSIVDVKARDAAGRLYQVEVQMVLRADLPARMLYTWADLYAQQLRKGQKYGALRPTYAIWLLATNLVSGDTRDTHAYQFRDEDGQLLLDHGGIWLLELNKFAADRVHTEKERWLKFFQEGEQLDETHLPDWMQTEEMRQAMSTLKAFSERERAYFAYQARQDYLREQESMRDYLQTLEAEKETARAELEAAQGELVAAQAELEAAQAELQAAQAAKDAAQAAKEAMQAAKEAMQAEKEKAQAEKEAMRIANDAALAAVARLEALLRRS